ncbi:MAG: hypothetical protein RMK75_07885 [Aquificaceae bacterium]|nr:hypothetical protein [Aquificaceae bacterium]MDW8424220.1 hypothetical protein [Aquificaceae bacterium]
MKELYKNKEGQVFFLYGGEQYEGYLEKARQTFPEIPVSNLFFAVNVARALEQVVQELLRQREQLDHPYHPFALPCPKTIVVQARKLSRTGGLRPPVSLREMAGRRPAILDSLRAWTSFFVWQGKAKQVMTPLRCVCFLVGNVNISVIRLTQQSPEKGKQPCLPQVRQGI